MLLITRGLEHQPLSMAPTCLLVVTLVSLLFIFKIIPLPQPFLPADCSELHTPEVANKSSSGGKSEPMVFPGGPSLHHCRFGNGRGHDTRPRISLLGSGKEEIRSDHALGHNGLLLYHHIPMVLLGLFPGVFGTRDKRIHWRSEALWLDQHARCAESWIAADSRVAL